ncbi:putative Serine/threonine-protein phosphatase 2A 65 kDa regulatory subunit A alpha [Blattamonas nauphoetae]|uniref:Serine/threonine-protein phosphatase 2A 65 kDa regulatory subunit A alpha n=1 Tax=Blattamonas nauphoetae TaxID=2049346 RepID=A0ABQ9Y400_9EUKA|nr:putative Serine/threonine-protein phosphatase 2A 65 kDa regulatory subunit A alpha [Blattamonas nauphoetae]
MSLIKMTKVPDAQLIEVAALLDGLRSEEQSQRLKSVKGLPLIASTLGAERTRNELLPFLQDCTMDEADVLVSMAEVLGTMLPHVDGPANVTHLLPILEQLAIQEDTHVRETALHSIITLTTGIPASIMETTVFELGKRLAVGDWITKRASAPSILPHVYPHCNAKQKEEILKMTQELCGDPIILVRRNAAKSLMKLVGVVDRSTAKNTLIPLFKTLLSDLHDSIRIWLMDILVAFVTPPSPITNDEIKSTLISFYKQLADDKSWRIKFKVAERTFDFASKVQENLVRTDIIPCVLNLLKDNEMEVRTITAAVLADFGGLLSSDVIVKSIIPRVKELARDENETLKESLACTVMKLAPKLNKADFTTHILPLISDFLSVEQSAEVKASAVSNLSCLKKNVELTEISPKIIAAVQSLATDKQWRVRLTVIDYIPYIASQLGPRGFNEKLLPHCLNWIKDTVYAVREEAIANLTKIGSSFGTAWIKTSLLPFITELTKSSGSYLHRLTALSAFRAFAPLTDAATIHSTIFPAVAPLTKDPVPNVRFNAAKTIRSFILAVDQPQMKKEMQVVIERLQNDPDNDVKYFAQKALEGL